MISVKECPVCSGTNFIKKLTCKDYTKSKEIFKIVSCETCGFTFTNPRPSDQKIGDYY